LSAGGRGRLAGEGQLGVQGGLRQEDEAGAPVALPTCHASRPALGRTRPGNVGLTRAFRVGQGKFKRRWFVLEGGEDPCLHYFAKDSDQQKVIRRAFPSFCRTARLAETRLGRHAIITRCEW
jgi:hypothetical protein